MSKKICRSWRSPSPLYHTLCDQKIVEHFKWAYDEDHKQVKVSTGKEDVYALIQSFEPETGVYNVIRLVQARGEGLDRLDASRGQGFYGDVSDMPDNIHDLHVRGMETLDLVKKYNDMLGTSFNTEELLAAFADGTIDKLIAAKIAPASVEEKPAEGEK